MRSAATLDATQFGRWDVVGAEATLKKAESAAPQSTEAALALTSIHTLEDKKLDAEAELRHVI